MRWLLTASAAIASLATQPQAAAFHRPLFVSASGEVRLLISAGCARCDWGAPGREAAVVRISIDGRYSQHLALVRGEAPADYSIGVGSLAAGEHQLTIERDPALSAAQAGALSLDLRSTTVAPDPQIPSGHALAQSMAPILYARPNTVGRFTDLPLLMWYETAATPRGEQIRYSVIFSNEDGGTPTDRLMATWGRTTDIEYIYGVEIDAEGRVTSEEFQGPGHEVPPFRGRHEGRHPLLWVSTDNNMVSESGSTTIRYAPAPEPWDLDNMSREAVMDRHPWTYVVAAKELAREGKLDDAAAPGSGKIPDPRRFVTVEACSNVTDAALAFGIRPRTADGDHRWYDSDRGMPDFRVARSGCFRAAVPLPSSPKAFDGLRFRAYPKPAQNGRAAPAPSAVVTRVNAVFTLGPAFLPQPPVFSRLGPIELPVGGDWVEIPIERR